jgi:ABC-type ATPase involved in cell division
MAIGNELLAQLSIPLCKQFHQVCFIAGPSGCGKTSTVRVLAAENGVEVTEWTTPTPTLWAEHIQQVSIQLSFA